MIRLLAAALLLATLLGAARILLDYLASAIAMAEEVSR